MGCCLTWYRVLGVDPVASPSTTCSSDRRKSKRGGGGAQNSRQARSNPNAEHRVWTPVANAPHHINLTLRPSACRCRMSAAMSPATAADASRALG